MGSKILWSTGFLDIKADKKKGEGGGQKAKFQIGY